MPTLYSSIVCFSHGPFTLCFCPVPADTYWHSEQHTAGCCPFQASQPPAAALCLQIQFGTATAEHDLTVKLRKAKELLDKGHKVKCNVRFKAPLWQGQAQARAVMDSISERMAGAALVEPPAPTEKQERTCLYFYLNPVSAGSAPVA